MSFGCFLQMIGGWIWVGGAGTMVLVGLLMWGGVSDIKFLQIIAGLCAMGFLFTAGTGIGFMMAGPRKNGLLGLSIALGAVSLIHIVFAFVVANDAGGGFMGGGRFAAGSTGGQIVSQLPNLATIMLALGAGFEHFPVLAFFGTLLEVARFVLLGIYLNTLLKSVKESRAGKSCFWAGIGTGIVTGSMALLGLLMGLIGKEAGSRSLIMIFIILTLLSVVGVAVWTTLAVKTARESIDNRL